MKDVTMRDTALAVLLLVVAASCRLLLEVLAMPPYAGLDEPFHVARLAFVRSKGRNPTRQENSVPPYIIASTECLPGVPPAFSQAGPRWPELALSAPWPDPRVRASHDYVIPNYQAQHPSLYYTLLAPLPRLAGAATRLTELTTLRLASVLFALLAIAGVTSVAVLVSGRRGLLAGALLVVAPNWLSLVGRVSNDSLACGLLAVAVALSLRRRIGIPGVAAEAAVWAGAVATKLYAWPAVVLLPWLWRKSPRREWLRITIVALAVALSLVSTALDLKARTGTFFGSQAFDQAAARTANLGSITSLEWGKWLRVFFASAVWMPGQHGDALRPLGMALYVLPVLAFATIAMLRRPPTRREQGFLLAAAITLSAFGVAQAVNAAGFVRRALEEGKLIPAGGAEGWYFWSQAPFLFGVLLAVLLVPRRSRPIAVVILVLWLLAWDVLLHEGGLFRDWAGLASPATPGTLFRWGTRSHELTGSLDRLAVTSASGVPAAMLLILRAGNVAATLLLAGLVLRKRAHGSSGSGIRRADRR
jgi:hypothetical protein